MKTIHFNSIDSTNTYLKTHYQELDHFTWVSTDFQQVGRGRSSKSWFGDQDSLMCSVLLKTNLAYEHIPILPLLAAQSLHKVLLAYDTNIQIKWPNDLVINALKLSGILVESLVASNQILAIIIGFGVNLNQDHFNSELKEIATSLKIISNQTIDQAHLYQELIKQFETDYQVFESNPQMVIDYCNQYNALKDQMITFANQNEQVQGKVIKIENNGHLLVKTKTGNQSILSGEVSISKQTKQVNCD